MLSMESIYDMIGINNMATLRLTFQDRVNNKHQLNYEIYQTDLASRWIGVVKENQQKHHNVVCSFSNKTNKNLSQVREDMNVCIKVINSNYDKILPFFKNVKNFDVKILNYLHEEYEIYGEKIDYFHNEELENSFIKLNHLIHLYEEAQKNTDDCFPNMSALFDFHPFGIHHPLLERDKIHLITDYKWGQLFLGYNTLGKDWSKVSIDNDIEVIKRNMVKSQQKFAAEAWINFGPDSTGHWENILFEKWFLGLPEELQKKVPIDNLNRLCFGRFLIGELIIDHNFLKFESNQDLWSVPTSTTKSRWNQEVFSTFEKLVNLEIE